MKPIEIVAGGTKYRLNLPDADQDYIQKTIASTQRPYEEAMLIDIADGVAAGDLVLDVGANCGNHTLYLACVAGAEVQAFEPDVELCGVIRSSASLNGVDSLVTVHEVGVGDAEGFGRIVQTAENNRGAQRLQRVSSEENGTTIIRLDDLEFSKPVRAMKIDVEGMELDVLNGAKLLIERDRPEIYVECQTRQDFERIHTWLAQYDYRYLSTFNATPTHRFGPSSSADGRDRFEQIVKQQVAATYYDQQLISQLRKSLTEANLKYRGATATLAPINEQLRMANVAEAQQSEVIQKLRQDLLESANRVHDFETVIEEKENQLTGVRSQLHVASLTEHKNTERAKALSVQLQDLRDGLRRERNRVKAVEKQIAQANAQIIALESLAAEQAKRHDEDRQSWQLELEQSNSQLSRASRKAKLQAAKSRSTLIRERAIASDLRDTSTRLAEVEAAKSRSALIRERAIASDLRDTSTRLAEVEAALVDSRHQSEETARRLVKEKGMVSRLEQALDESQREKVSLQNVLAESKKENASLQSRLRDIRKQLDDTQERRKTLESEAVEADVKIETAQADNDRLQSALALAEAKLVDLRASVTFRLGKSIRESLTSPKGLGVLPVALGRLAVEHRQRHTVARTIIGEIVANEQAIESEEKPAPTPVNRAAELRASRLLSTSDASAALQLTSSAHHRNTRVAAIMDEFTVQSFAPECELLELSLGNYIDELNSFSPSLVFLESAWRGKNDAWGNKVAQTSAEVREIISWSKSNNVPVVLWNKEDPVHYSTFLNTAKLVDHVFTTDIDCVQRYKGDLGHNRVHFLPFACQPVLHNPLEVYRRSAGMCFAGAYYRRYPARTRDLESFMAEIPKFTPLEIFDRNFGKSDQQYQFPKEYQEYIVGTLTSSEIDLAYKGYDYAINLNSVKESQSMFARRVYELLASNTTVVSNYSRGLQLLFGDIPVIADSGRVVVNKLSSTTDGWGSRRRRLAGLRKVMQEHTYSHRLEYVLNQAGVPAAATKRPTVVVLGLVSSDAEVGQLLATVNRQIGVDVSLRLYTMDASWVDQDGAVQGITVQDVSKSSGEKLESCVEDGAFAAVMVPDDYYGANYLLDLALAARYSAAVVVGKVSYFQAKGRTVGVNDSRPAYTAVTGLPVRASLVLKPREIELGVDELVRTAAHADFGHASMLGAELFDYCRDGAGLTSEVLSLVTSGKIDSGLRLEEMVTAGDQIEASNFVADQGKALSGAEVANLFVTRSRPGVTSEVSDNDWNFVSTLGDGVHDYIYATELIGLDSIATEGQLELHVEASPGLNLQVAIIYYDGANTKIEGHVRAANQNCTLDIPGNAKSVKLGIRIFASGEGSLRRILWKHKNIKPAFIASRAQNLVITNRYPSYDDLYKNAFVHSRVLRYIDSGVPTEVFVLDENSHLRFREFEGVTVISGSSSALDTLLLEGKHRSISLHFVNDSMWDAVRNLPQKPQIAIWAHGADIQKWSRRSFLYSTDEEVRAAEEISDRRLALWRRIFEEAADSVSVIFVSKWLAETAMSDLGLVKESSLSVVIHNPIDTTKFEYQKKTPGHRLKVLSIRPYASSVYANDLTVDAILLLSQTAYFSDMEFRLVGDGPLFDEMTKPLEGFSNVILDKRFLTQDEIASMHKEYGVFLCPSRMDTHGVSRDEAMASGLVPVTTSVAAIPEFADATCAELVEPENAAEIADALMRLASSSRLFRRKSLAAAKRVRRQAAASNVIPKELQVLGY
ncbi:FkbM family methyltransferase [Paenarthrobacter sp. NPDC056912]|uniref:FkbM family methyltransferase n=1 Tax=Paenarthrobacter sp. NPDC056912 TaxID=3345965 RepID=UPI00366D2A2E